MRRRSPWRAWAPDGKSAVPLRCGGVVRDTPREAIWTAEKRATLANHGRRNGSRAARIRWDRWKGSNALDVP